MTGLTFTGNAPSGWKIERAKWLLTRQDRAARSYDATVTAFRDGQVTRRDRRRNVGFTDAVLEVGYHGVREGDLVVHSMDAFAGAIGVSDSDGKMSPVVHIYKARGSFDERFGAYLLRAMAVSGFITTLTKGIRERSTSFDASVLAEVQFAYPEIEEQCRIADFLDREVEQSERISGKLRRIVLLARERATAAVDVVLHDSFVAVPVASVCTAVVDCVNKTAPVGHEETPYKMIRTSNVRDGEIDLSDAPTVSLDTFEKWNRRGAPRLGDIVFTREAPVGQVGMVRDETPVFLGQRTILYRADNSRISRDLLLYNFLSSRMRSQLDRLGAGSLHPHIRVGDCSKLEIRFPPRVEQDALVSRIEELRDESLQLLGLVESQLALLAERRQALITAAVTGQIDVSTARGVEV